MLSFREVTLRRGANVLFADVSFTVHAGRKVGVVGANGAGKSSLFALIRDELEVDTGSVRLPAGTTIGHVAQETPAADRTALDYVLDGDTALRRVESRLQDAERDDDGHRVAELHAQLHAIDAYTAPARAGAILHGLGFDTGDESRRIATFSGGWRMRLNLAQALMSRSDLLLLDEPTNHLDLDAVIWLESWLRGYPGTLLLVSHDRDFLDPVVDSIAHVAGGTIKLYRGDYSAFEKRRAEQLAQQQVAYAKQQRVAAHMQSFVERFRYKASKARQAQSRLKALSRMQAIAPAHVDSPFQFSFRRPERLPQPLISLDEAAAGYADHTVLSALRFHLMPGDRIGLLGRNGAGKSTLIKLLSGELQARAGAVEASPHLRIGYFAQHQLDRLRLDRSPIAHLRELDAAASEQALRVFLGGFNFHGDAVLRPVQQKSGGEKARLALSLVLYARPNLLLLDRAHQPSGPGDAPRPECCAAGVSRRRHGRLSRPVSVEPGERCLVAGRRRARHALRRRPGRLRAVVAQARARRTRHTHGAAARPRRDSQILFQLRQGAPQASRRSAPCRATDAR